MPSLKMKIQSGGPEALDRMDGLVHDAASRIASRANKERLDDQLDLLS